VFTSSEPSPAPFSNPLGSPLNSLSLLPICFSIPICVSLSHTTYFFLLSTPFFCMRCMSSNSPLCSLYNSHAYICSGALTVTEEDGQRSTRSMQYPLYRDEICIQLIEMLAYRNYVPTGGGGKQRCLASTVANPSQANQAKILLKAIPFEVNDRRLYRPISE
jgi:hypothetical protein